MEERERGCRQDARPKKHHRRQHEQAAGHDQRGEPLHTWRGHRHRPHCQARILPERASKNYLFFSERTNRLAPFAGSGCRLPFQTPKLSSNAFWNLIRLDSLRNASPITLLCAPFGTVLFNSSKRSSGNVKFAKPR